MNEGLVRAHKTPMGKHIHDELDEDLNLFYKDYTVDGYIEY